MFNIVLLAEGFSERAAERRRLRPAPRSSPRFRATSPFGWTPARAFNVFRVNVASDGFRCGRSGIHWRLRGGGSDIYFDAQFGVPMASVVCSSATTSFCAPSRLSLRCLLVQLSFWLWSIPRSTVGAAVPLRVFCSWTVGATEIALHELGHSAFRTRRRIRVSTPEVSEPDRANHPGPEPIGTECHESRSRWCDVEVAPHWSRQATADTDDDQSRLRDG